MILLLGCDEQKGDSLPIYKDKNGIIYDEYIGKFQHKSYQYYKNKSLYKIEFLRNFFSDKNILESIQMDSCILFSMHTKIRMLKLERLDEMPNDSRQIITFYSEKNHSTKKDTLENYNEYRKIEKNILGSDTLQLQYNPVIEYIQILKKKNIVLIYSQGQFLLYLFNTKQHKLIISGSQRKIF